MDAKQNFRCMRKQVIFLEFFQLQLFPQGQWGQEGGPASSFCEPHFSSFHAGVWATTSLCPVAQVLRFIPGLPLPLHGWAMTMTMAWNHGGEVQ